MIFAETNRFILRAIEPRDVEGMFLLDSDPRVHTYLGNNPIESKDQAQAIIEAVRKQYTERGIGRWAVEWKDNGAFVGWTGLKHEIDSNFRPPHYDLGFRLRPEYWGKGIAYESGLIALNYGFNELKLDQICAAADQSNIGSNKVLKKLGFHWKEDFFYGEISCHWYEIHPNQTRRH